MRFLSELAKFDRIKTIQTVATAAVTSDIIDMAGFDGVLFVVIFGAITDGTPSVKAQQDSDSAMGAAADLEGTSVAVDDADDDNKMLLLDIYQPDERYVRAVVTRGGSTGCVVDAILAIQYGARNEPVTQSADVVATERHVSPAEGTA